MSRQPSGEGSPQELAKGSPRDLHPTSDIRFVIVEVSKLAERVEGLAAAVEKVAPGLERALDKHAADVKERTTELKADAKEDRGKLTEIEKSMSFVKGAIWVLGGFFTLALVVIGAVLAKLLGS